MRRVRVGDVLRLERRAVAIDPLDDYTLIGVYSFGKGIFHREPQSGASLGDYRFFAIEPGDLVLSNIQAWEGAIAFAREADRGTIGTHRFLTYVPRGDDVDMNFLHYYFLSEQGHALIQKAAPGSVTRNRTLSIERFENLEVLIPEVSVQRRMALSLDSKLGATSSIVQFTESSSRNDLSLAESTIDRVLARAGERCGYVALGAVAQVNPGSDRVDPDEEVAFVPMSAVDDVTGVIARAERRTRSDVGAGYKQFRKGDVIFARITPCMQNGKSAVFSDQAFRYGYGSTEFHVLRPTEAISAAWLHEVVRSAAFRSRAADNFTGTAGQQRVSASFLESARIPLPDLGEQGAILAETGSIWTAYLRIRQLRIEQRQRARALSPSILNHAFANLTV